jgi:hypothetical protein
MNNPTKSEYHEALHSYFHKTNGYVFPSIVPKLEREIELVTKYEEMNNPKFMNRKEIVAKRILNLVAHLVGAIIYAFLIMYALNEILGLSIDTSLANTALIILLIIGWKTKFRLYPMKEVENPG